jgi:hypothetical protein
MTNNSLPAMQLADEFDGQHAFAGQPLMPAQGGIVLDEELAPPQDNPSILPAEFSAHIGDGPPFINEREEYGGKSWMERFSPFARPPVDLVDFDPFATRGVIEGTIESWRTIMK